MENKYQLKNIYLNEFQFYDVESYITFNIIDIDTEKMTINLAKSNCGKISLVEYDLNKDNAGNLYFSYGIEHKKINVDDFEEVED